MTLLAAVWRLARDPRPHSGAAAGFFISSATENRHGQTPCGNTRARQVGARRRPPGPKPGTRSHRKLSYTPDMLADAGDGSKRPDEPLTAIARDYGVGATTMYSLVKSEGWRRRQAQDRSMLTAGDAPEGAGGVRP